MSLQLHELSEIRTYQHRNVSIDVIKHGKMLNYPESRITCGYLTLFPGVNLHFDCSPLARNGARSELEVLLDDVGEFHGGVTYFRFSAHLQHSWHMSTYPVVRVGCDYNHDYDVPETFGGVSSDMSRVVDRLINSGIVSEGKK